MNRNTETNRGPKSPKQKIASYLRKGKIQTFNGYNLYVRIHESNWFRNKGDERTNYMGFAWEQHICWCIDCYTAASIAVESFSWFLSLNISAHTLFSLWKMQNFEFLFCLLLQNRKMKWGRRESGWGRSVGADAELHGMRVIRSIRSLHISDLD